MYVIISLGLIPFSHKTVDVLYNANTFRNKANFFKIYNSLKGTDDEETR